MTPPHVLTYADDFTGATDALATAARAGLHSLLFLRVPDDALRARAGALDWLGVAGAARSMAPAAMATELAPVAALFRDSGARLLHYKTCSTFDSAPQVGNIATAIAALRPAVSQAWTAIVGGQPSLGRYCAFGHLFAAAGSDAQVFRLDRHPTMSRHPVTPMHESDLRLHLAAQGLANIALLPWTAYAQAGAGVAKQLAHLLQPAPDAVLFDVLQPADLPVVGRVLRMHAQDATVLAAGPSSVLQAWASDVPAANDPIAAAAGPVFVLAGSLSPVTAQQVQAAVSYEKIWLDPVQLAAPQGRYLQDSAGTIAALLRQGRPVLACTVTPGQDSGQVQHALVSARDIALAGGRLLAQVLALAPLRRAGVAGGDTSSLAVQALDAWGLSYLGTLAPGAALCRLHSDQPALDGVEILLKGGQMGDAPLFERLLHGRPA